MATGTLPPALAEFIANLPPMMADQQYPAPNVDVDFLLSQILRIDLPRICPAPQMIAPVAAPPSRMFTYVPHQHAPPMLPPPPHMRNFAPRVFVPRQQKPMMPPPAQTGAFVPPQQAAAMPWRPPVESKSDRRFTGKRKAKEDDDEDSKEKRQTPPIDIFKIRQIQKARAKIAAASGGSQSTSGSSGSSGRSVG